MAQLQHIKFDPASAWFDQIDIQSTAFFPRTIIRALVVSTRRCLQDLGVADSWAAIVLPSFQCLALSGGEAFKYQSCTQYQKSAAHRQAVDPVSSIDHSFWGPDKTIGFMDGSFTFVGSDGIEFEAQVRCPASSTTAHMQDEQSKRPMSKVLLCKDLVIVQHWNTCAHLQADLADTV